MNHPFKISVLVVFCIFCNQVQILSQEITDSSTVDKVEFQFSGSADIYYKFDLAEKNNIPTSFGEDHNSISLGMIAFKMYAKTKKSSMVAELAFGPRSANSVGPPTEQLRIRSVNGSSVDTAYIPLYLPRIQNLYISHDFSPNWNISAGYMSTFVGYELISPVDNFNYSTSYLFTNGPFQNAGVKLNFQKNKIGLMVGIFNPWNVYQAPADIGPSSFGTQLSITDLNGWSVYLNLITGGESGTEIDLTTSLSIRNLTLGLNTAYYNSDLSTSGTGLFYGTAIYVNYQLPKAAVGIRYELFNANAESGILNNTSNSIVNALTLSGNIGNGALKFIPEFRFEYSDNNLFLDRDGNISKSASQLLLAAIYQF